jgi:hypothetical protein
MQWKMPEQKNANIENIIFQREPAERYRDSSKKG